MEEALYKARRIDNGEWVEGYFLKDGIGCFICEEDCIRTNLGRDDRYGEYRLEIRAYIVDANTLCRYTGIDDRKRNRIFENDMIGHEMNLVEMLNGMWCVNGDRPLFIMAKEFEVIGNAFDNAELVGKEV